MSDAVSRRRFLQAAGAVGAAVSLRAAGPRVLSAAETPKGTPNVDRLGWRVACCTYTFRQFTFYEAIQKTTQLGLRYLEGFSWQPLSPEHRDVKLNEAMPDPLRKQLKQRLDDTGVKLVSCYVASLPNQEAASRKIFEFGKQLGMETFVSEPAPEAFDLLARLADEYRINIAIHNHPKPSSRYWNPQAVADVCRGRSRRIGCCADTGHWVRSGLHPVDALRLLGDRVLTFHLKDIVQFGVVKAEDCAWGTGQGDIRGILAEMHRRKAKPVFGIEYERAGEIGPDLRQSISFLEQVAGSLAG
jgi:sugar phosphate isomerase/epimerase